MQNKCLTEITKKLQLKTIGMLEQVTENVFKKLFIHLRLDYHNNDVVDDLSKSGRVEIKRELSKEILILDGKKFAEIYLESNEMQLAVKTKIYAESGIIGDDLIKYMESIRGLVPPNIHDVYCYFSVYTLDSPGDEFYKFFSSINWTLNDKKILDWQSRAHQWNKLYFDAENHSADIIGAVKDCILMDMSFKEYVEYSESKIKQIIERTEAQR